MCCLVTHSLLNIYARTAASMFCRNACTQSSDVSY
jgi:hypothetical protein